MNLFLVRHGISEGNINKAKYFEKLDCDIELAEQGKEHAVNAANRIMDISDKLMSEKITYDIERENIRYNMFYSSYKRAKQTANIIHGVINSHTVANQIDYQLTRQDVINFSPWIPHIEEVAINLAEFLSDEDLIRPFNRLGMFYEGQSFSQQAEVWYQQFGEVAKQRLGEEHPDFATILTQ